MELENRTTAAVLAGYLLGRTEDFDLAATAGDVISVLYGSASPSDLGEGLQEFVAASEKLSELSDEARDQLFEAVNNEDVQAIAERFAAEEDEEEPGEEDGEEAADEETGEDEEEPTDEESGEDGEDGEDEDVTEDEDEPADDEESGEDEEEGEAEDLTEDEEEPADDEESGEDEDQAEEEAPRRKKPARTAKKSG